MQKGIIWFFAVVCAIYLIGFGIDVMDVDASQYASMSREMLSTGNYLQVYDLGKEYLDKPPFLFWVSALSMKIFGVNNFAYRFPSFLFALLAIYSTFKFSLLYYKKEIAYLAAIVLASCQAMFLINHDVRTDTILMSWVIFSVWQLAAWYQYNKLYQLLLAAAGIAGGLMTKGPIALFVPIFAFGSHFILQRNYKVFFKWEYLLALVIIGILLLPMCIGLYQQFDLQPDKVVIGKTGVSGLRFFFWTQSFGRITGESEWNNGANIFFLIQNMLWSFLPWILCFLIALYLDIKQLVQQRFKLLADQEWITTGGFILSYLSLGMSKYQLPHYIFVVFPFASVITAKFLYALAFEYQFPKVKKALEITHFILFTLLWIVLVVLLLFCFNTIPVWIGCLAVLFMIASIVLFFQQRRSNLRLITISLFTIMSVNLFLNFSLYPTLLKYQMGSSVGRWIHDNKIPSNRFYVYNFMHFDSLDFYAQGIIKQKDSVEDMAPGDYIILAKDNLQDLEKASKRYQVLYENNDFHITTLSLQFINPATRPGEIKPYV
ncbi:MAG: glycosyltransferase family 39 protein, partial [Sphingobacteriales bacterium]|nr:glycosyltransferase family 39 protein [Sphingobacteriales bacterium]